MNFFRNLFGSLNNDQNSESSKPRPKFVPPPPPDPPVDGIVTMAYIRQMLEEIRQHPQHTQEPRWAYIFDYFIDSASDDERQELIATVSNDQGLWQRSPHAWRQKRDATEDLVVYLRRMFVSIILDDGHGHPTPCELPRTIDRERNLAQRRGMLDDFNTLLDRLPTMATPRIAEIFRTGSVNPSSFHDVGVEHCDDIPSEYLATIQDDRIHELFKPLQIAYRKADDWLHLADFWREEATPEQRREITTVIHANKLYHVAKYPSDFNMIENDPARFITLSLTLCAMENAAPDWREAPLTLSKTTLLARQHNIDIKPVCQTLFEISEENAQKVFKGFLR